MRIMTTLRQQSGFGLLEVLIAMLIMAVGLLGISGVQLRATQAEMESYQRAQAMLLLDDMANRMRSNSISLACYVLDANVGTGAEGFAGTGCDVLADNDLIAWHNLLLGAAEVASDGVTNVGAMIKARGCITFDDVNNTYTITVAWQGLGDTFAPAGNDCGLGQYDSPARRRLATEMFQVGTLL